uniref:Uncharacterized protein n=1 Tax=Anguilla anguilla TaxID=7936 RepID=A0A0E9VV08_ANGAN
MCHVPRATLGVDAKRDGALCRGRRDKGTHSVTFYLPPRGPSPEVVPHIAFIYMLSFTQPDLH